MAAMKDITNYSSSTEEARHASSSDDNIFVDFSTPTSSRSARRSTRPQTSPARPLLRILNHASSNENDGRTSRLAFTEDFTALPSVLLTPTTPNEPDKSSKFTSFSHESCRPRKKLRLERSEDSAPRTPLQATLQSLTKPQLVELINNLVSKKHPELTEEFQQLIPEPDLKDMEDKLRCLKRNIYKAFPRRTRSVCSSRDAFSFRRVNSHIQTFKKECIDQGSNLISSGLWRSTMEYVLLAYPYINDLPMWESPVHNCSKTRCFKTLAVQCNKALINGEFTSEELQRYEQRLKDICIVNKDLEPCLKQVKQIISNQSFNTNVTQ